MTYQNPPPGFDSGGESSSSNSRIVWLVVAVAAIVFLCIGGMGLSAVFIFLTQEEGEAVFLPPPPTLTATAVAAPIEPIQPTVSPIEPHDGQVTANRFVTPPTIDGDLREWSAVPAFTAGHIVAQQATWDGTLDAVSTWRVGWDAQNLYMAVVVEDDRHVQTRETKFAYLGDSLEVQFDTNVADDYGAAVSSDDFQYIVSPGNFSTLPAGIFRFRGDAQGNMVDYFGSQATAVAVQTGNGYIIEVALPWTDLNVQPEANQVLGAAFSVNDLDTPDTAVQELMLSHVSTRKWLDPTSWGSVILVP